MPRPRKHFALVAQEDRALETQTVGFSVSAVDQTLPKAAQVYDVIRRAIVQLALPPGAPVLEKQICDVLGVSKTPLREAILQLAAENLVVVVPNSGTFVARIDLQDVFDGQLVREALEMKVVRLAAQRMSKDLERSLDFNMYRQKILAAERAYDEFYELDEALHRTICEAGSSRQVWRIINSAKAQLDRVRRLAFPVESHLDIVLAEHAMIVDALKVRDPEAAASAMSLHVNRVFDTIRKLISEKRDYFDANAMVILENYTAPAV
jgi:GntR family transcriptional regulator, rspAB operon transcriptional repressor